MASRRPACDGPATGRCAMSTVATTPQDDLYAAVTGRIIAALERGAPPWVRPWSQDVDAMPVNAAGRRPYRGINALLLTTTSNCRHHARFLTRGATTRLHCMS